VSGLNTILVIDDELSIRESLEMFFKEKSLGVLTAGTGERGRELWLAHHPAVIVLDIRLPDLSGLELLKEIAEREPEIKVIMITAFHDMETTIEAMRNGAYDYIHKPLDVDELDQVVGRALKITQVGDRSRPLGPESRVQDPARLIIGRTPAMRSIFKTIGLLSRNRATVLIEGETGTGKELIARVIHQASTADDQPLVTVDCTTLVENLLESELFGHRKGAFTGAVEDKKGRLELAGEGTIFFDEIGDLPLGLQAKLLRFLEYRTFTPVGGVESRRSRARIIAATNHDLEELAKSGRFRQDLLFRLKVISILVPPLRKRLSDLPDLVSFFLARINEELNLNISRFEKGVLALLEAHPWPGNVRELRNILTKAALDSQGTILLKEALRPVLAGSTQEPPRDGSLRTLDEVEKEHVLKALLLTGWNISAAAKALGLSRPTLRKKIQRYGLSQPGRKTQPPAKAGAKAGEEARPGPEGRSLSG